MRKLLTFALLALLGALIGASSAFAAWKLTATSPTGTAKATSLPAMTAPNTSVNNATVTISFPAANLATSYEIKRYNSVNVATVITPTCSGSVTLSCTDPNVVNGSYNYTIAAKRGNWKGAESAKKAATVNVAPPTIAIAHPINNGVFSNTSWNAACSSSICGTASSASGVANVKISVRRGSTGMYWTPGSDFNSSSEILFDANGTTSWSVPFATSNFGLDDTYTVRAVATDISGNNSSVSNSFRIDRTGPSTGQFGVSVIRNGQQLSIGSASDPSGVAGVSYYYSTSSAWTTPVLIGSSTAGPTYPVVWNAQPVDGAYFFRAIVSDTLGNTVTLNASGNVDNTAPITTSNATGAWSNVNQTLTLTPTDNLPYTIKTYYTLDGSTPTTSSIQGTVIPFSSNGIYTIKYFSVDFIGNVEAMKTATVLIDKSSPNAPVITAPASNAWIKNGATLTATASDNPGVNASGIAAVRFYCNTCTTNLIGEATSAPYSVVWNSQPANGTHTIQAQAVDNAGNVTLSTAQNVRIDNTAPTVSFVSGATNGIVRGTISPTATASDTPSTVANVAFQYSPTGANTWTTFTTDSVASGGNTYNGSLNSTLVADGVYDMRALATDNAGNQTAVTVTVVIDNVFAPTSVQLLNGPGNTAGKIEKGDQIVVTYSDAIDVSTMCDDWTNDSADQTLSGSNVVVTLDNGNGSNDDTLRFDTITGCGGFNFGEIDLNSGGYVSNSDATFGGSGANSTIVSWNFASKTLTITLGAKGGTGTIPTTAVTTGTPAYIRDTDLRNIYNRAMTVTSFSAPSGQRF